LLKKWGLIPFNPVVNQSMGGTLGSLSRFLVRLTDLSASASLQEEGTGATTGRKPNGMISDHAWGASDCLSAFEVSIEISLSVPGFHKALPFVAALGDIRYTPVIH
jgi:hypothetical protein